MADDKSTQHEFANINYSDELPNKFWMIRPCEIYKDEYDECASFKGRWNQKYIYGEEQDCTKWQENYQNCLHLRKTESIESALKIIENEEERLSERRKQEQINDVWEYRTEPPPEWNAPLPDGLTKNAMPENLGKELINSESQRTCTIS